MKKVSGTLFIFLLSCYSVLSQSNIWEFYLKEDIKHPFTFPVSQLTDTENYSWSLGNKELYKAKNGDTTRFSNFPTLNTTTSLSHYLHLLEDNSVLFLVTGYNNEHNVSEQYLGYCNGTELKFFSEQEFRKNPISNHNPFRFASTGNNIFIMFNDEIIKFDKNETFTSYTYAEIGLDNQKYQHFNYDLSGYLYLSDGTKKIVYSELDNSWQEILSDVEIYETFKPRKSSELYLIGKQTIYKVRHREIEPLVITGFEELGNYNYYPSKELKKNLSILFFTNGAVILDNELITTKILNHAPNRQAGTPSLLDNDIVTFSFLTYTADFTKLKREFYSYKNNLIHFEVEDLTSSYKSFLYKSVKEENTIYNAYSNAWSYKGNLEIIKNNELTENIHLPNNIPYLHEMYVDSNYVWLRCWGDSLWRLQIGKPIFKGTVFYDSNQNGIKDSMELPVSKYPLIVSPSGLKIYPDANGEFMFSGEKGQSYKIDFPDKDLFGYTSVALPEEINETSINWEIGVKLKDEIKEVERVFNIPWTRCNTISSSTFSIKNSGFIPIDKITVSFIADTATIVSSSEAFQEGNKLVYQIQNLGAQRTIDLPYEIIWPDFTLMGEELKFLIISQIDGQAPVVDSITTTLRCSYDPNDKAVEPAGIGNEKYTLKNSNLNYLIRFENTGNDTAYTVTVHDTLSSHLDFSTLKVLESSHTVQTTITEGGVIIFHFNNIMLPDTNTNKEKANGYVRFSIMPKASNPDYTTIKNKAAIIFDQNPPVITNETVNLMVVKIPSTVLSLVDESNNKYNFYPNPANSFVSTNHPDAEVIEVINMTGVKVLITARKSVEVSTLPDGLYLLRTINKSGEIIQSEVVTLHK